MSERFDRLTEQVNDALPSGPRLVVIGSASFWHEDSERTCLEVGKRLAGLMGLHLVTGGVPGIGEGVGRAFFSARKEAGRAVDVFHVLPEGSAAWDYGTTIFAGADMDERREVLGRLSRVYLVIEGGPGTAHEARLAIARGSVVIPVGRSGGHSTELFARLSCPDGVDGSMWQKLGSVDSMAEDVATACHHLIARQLNVDI